MAKYRMGRVILGALLITLSIFFGSLQDKKLSRVVATVSSVGASSKTQLLENASGVFATVSEKQSAVPDLKELRAKIGQQALEIDFLAGALGRIGDASAKR